MSLFSFLKNKNETIEIIKQSDDALIFYVKNNAPKLVPAFGQTDDSYTHSLYTLLFEGIPLIKFHGEYCFCPTCEKLISAGYGIKITDEIIENINNQINAPFENIATSFNDLIPILELLPTGFYELSDQVLFPTDGNGHFFWTINNTPTTNPATAYYFDYDVDDFDYYQPKPNFILPTQSPSCLNIERVAYYQKNEINARAIAFYHSSTNLCSLIDGHHRATAVALKKETLKTLLISNPNEYHEKFIKFNKLPLYHNEIDHNLKKSIRKSNINHQLSNNETLKIIEKLNPEFDCYSWNEEIIESANHYPTIQILAAFEIAGDIGEKRLKNILERKEIVPTSALKHILIALFFKDKDLAINFTIALYKKEIAESYLHEDIFRHLSQYKKNPIIEDFFVEFLITDDNSRPWLTKIVDKYFL